MPSLNINVKNQAGNGVAGITVEVYTPPAWKHNLETSGTTGVNGQCNLNVSRPGAYEVRLMATGYAFDPDVESNPQHVPPGGLTIDLVAHPVSAPTTAWGTVPANAKIDAKFLLDSLQGTIEHFNQVIADAGGLDRVNTSHLSTIRAQMRRALERLDLSIALDEHNSIPCSTCLARYYTRGTPYYMNQTALNQCLYNPPCV